MAERKSQRIRSVECKFRARAVSSARAVSDARAVTGAREDYYGKDVKQTSF